MHREEWEDAWERLIAEGWFLCRERKFKPMIGRYWEIEARHEPSGRSFVIEAATLKIGMKKLTAALNNT